jgi:hypothetical protein
MEGREGKGREGEERRGRGAPREAGAEALTGRCPLATGVILNMCNIVSTFETFR